MHKTIAAGLLASTLLASTPEREETVTPPIMTTAPERVVAYVPDVDRITPAGTLIGMYHKVDRTLEDRYTISSGRLESHLDWLRTHGYAPVTFSDYVNTTAVTKPVVMTFDDSTEDNFRYLEDGSLDPHSAVGILERYRTRYPDWPVTATFFVNTTTEDGTPMFGQTGLERRKLEFLANNGYEIGSHGDRHADFSQLDTREIVENLATFKRKMRSYVPDYTVTSFAYPFGELPNAADQEVVESFFPFTARAWGGLATNEVTNVPRVEIGPDTRLNTYAPKQNVYK